MSTSTAQWLTRLKWNIATGEFAEVETFRLDFFKFSFPKPGLSNPQMSELVTWIDADNHLNSLRPTDFCSWFNEHGIIYDFTFHWMKTKSTKENLRMWHCINKIHKIRYYIHQPDKQANLKWFELQDIRFVFAKPYLTPDQQNMIRSTILKPDGSIKNEITISYICAILNEYNIKYKGVFKWNKSKSLKDNIQQHGLVKTFNKYKYTFSLETESQYVLNTERQTDETHNC